MTTQWRKSARSGGAQEAWVEVANLRGSIGLRDSKAPETGHLSVSVASFSDLIARVKRDELSL